ncbi:MAG: hypothetical protein ACTS43_02160 [Candidatus Hodgkinia cicadicola]
MSLILADGRSTNWGLLIILAAASRKKKLTYVGLPFVRRQIGRKQPKDGIRPPLVSFPISGGQTWLAFSWELPTKRRGRLVASATF